MLLIMFIVYTIVEVYFDFIRFIDTVYTANGGNENIINTSNITRIRAPPKLRYNNPFWQLAKLVSRISVIQIIDWNIRRFKYRCFGFE